MRKDWCWCLDLHEDELLTETHHPSPTMHDQSKPSASGRIGVPAVAALLSIVAEEEEALGDLSAAVEAGDDKRTLAIARKLAKLRTPSAAVIAPKP
jgi:hypothetical protein